MPTDNDETSLEQRIAETAAGPAAASGQVGSVTQHNLKDLIEADKHLSAKKASRKRKRGLIFSKIVPPSAQ